MYPEVGAVEHNAIKRHAVGCLLDTSELQKRIVLALGISRLLVRAGRMVSVHKDGISPQGWYQSTWMVSVHKDGISPPGWYQSTRMVSVQQESL